MTALLRVTLAALCSALAVAFAPRPLPSSRVSSLRLYDAPFAVVVQATIEPDRMAEFLDLIKTNAENTRKEPDCLRFDVLRSRDAPNEFFFYELYNNVEAIDYHKKQPHYQLWADFKESGGVIASTTYKTDAEFLT